MKIVKREVNPEIINTLRPHFIEDGSYTKDVMAAEFIDLMKRAPESICVLIGYDDDLISGFLIGWVCDNKDYSWIGQAVSIADTEFSKEGMEEFIKWSKSVGMKEVQFETQKDSVQMICAKRYGFNVHGITMSRKID